MRVLELGAKVALSADGPARPHRWKLYVWSAIGAIAASNPAVAQTTVSGSSASKVSLSGSDTLTVTGSGSLSTGSDKAVTIKTPTAVSITVNAGGSITSNDDAITTKTIDTSVGTIAITNNGTITSTLSGQAIDLNDVSAPSVTTTITNGATGSIIAENADGVRPGGNATVVNSGLIYADGPSGESHDGVDFQDYGGTVINEKAGTISGQRHGITSSVNVDVTNYGTIIGRNGSGVGSDGTGKVVNYGTIIGAYDGSGTGDGDGVDIDGVFYIDNYGTIKAQGAAGIGKDGDINRSEGVALTGGGTLINEKSGVITSVDIGGSVCCTLNPATIYNYGSIYGQNIGLSEQGLVTTLNYGSISSDGWGFYYVGNYDSALKNYGSVSGSVYAIMALNDGSTFYIDNYGTISGTTAIRIDPGSTVNLTMETGSAINGAIGLNGKLDVVTTGANLLTSAISGRGVLTTSGSGTLILTGSNTYTGGTTIKSGTLQLGNGGTSGSIMGDVLNNGALTFDRSDGTIFSGVVSGTGSVAQIGGGTLVMTGNNSYAGGTTIASGTLQLGDGGTSGSITGNILNNGALTFDRSDTVTFSDAISGTGSVAQIGGGTLVLTANNSYASGTTIASGALQLGDGGTNGSITGNILNNGALIFDRSDAVTFSGAISGTGSVTQIGGGTLFLTGSNSYAGATLLKAGVFKAGVAGAFSANSAFTVSSGTLLDANGISQTVKSLTNAGTVATNASASDAGATLTVLGNYVGQNGQLVLNASNGARDRLVVNGNLSGTTILNITRLGMAAKRTAGDGIELVQVGGTSQVGALKLASTITSGAYDYNLFLGGVGADAGSQNWYLRSVGYSPAAQSVLPYASSLVNIAEVALADSDVRARNSTGQGWWGRVIGQYGRFDAQNSHDFSTGVSYDQDLNLFQAGFEGAATRGKAGSLTLGLYGTVGFSRVNFALSADPLTGVTRGNSRITTTIFGLGTTASFKGTHGFYVDLVGQANAYSSNLSSVSMPHTHAWSGSASFETGQAIGLGQGWSIVPRTQVSWTHMGLEGFTDNSDNAISFADDNIVKGWAGLRLNRQAAWSAPSGKQRDLILQAAASMVHEFTRGTTVNVAGAELNQIQNRNWAEGSLSASYLRGKKLNLYTAATYARAVSGGNSHTFRPTVGLQASW